MGTGNVWAGVGVGVWAGDGAQSGVGAVGRDGVGAGRCAEIECNSTKCRCGFVGLTQVGEVLEGDCIAKACLGRLLDKLQQLVRLQWGGVVTVDGD